ncbi:MAG: Gfo/Idh/MocA family oxidoreductase [SAR202 cluster bacterium]|nr:Gfo/Idh/MocA family oxidoreductase [SAR202 cluster bacterium]
MGEKKYRVGMIGVGRKGTQHARCYALNPKCEIVAAADNDKENLDLFTSRFKVPGYSDYREMLKKEKIDIVSPILPVRPNAEVVIGCTEFDVKGIFCEKPMAVSLEEADRMVNAARKRNIRLAGGDMDANLPAHTKAKEIIDSGELGEVQSITFHMGAGSEMSGGGCQLFTLMRMFASQVDVAWSIGWVSDDPWSDHDQGASGYFRFVNGVEGFITRKQNARNGFEVLCSKGVYSSDYAFSHIYKVKEGVTRPAFSDLVEIKGVLPEGNIYGTRSAAMQYDADGWKWPGDRNMASVANFVDALDAGRDPVHSGDNGRKILEMAIGLRESARRGHAPVQFPIQDRSLRIIPLNWRLDNKKPIYGHETYMKQVRGHKKD